MDSHRVPTKTAATVTIGGIVFDNVLYDRDGDVLYVNVGDPAAAVDWDATAEGDGTCYGPDGSLIGMTILNARRRLEGDGALEFTLPEQRIVIRDVGNALD